MLRIEQLYYFLETAKAGSFTKAAKNLYLQQPSLREGIINLENDLGQPLLERTRKGVTLSAYGEYCLPYIQNMVDIYELLKDNKMIAQDKHKILQIEASSIYNMIFAMAASDELYRKSAEGRDCRISMNDDKNVVINRVLRRETDIGLIVYFKEDLACNKILMAQKNRAFKLIELARCELVIYMRKDHPLTRKKELTLADIEDYLLIFLMVSHPPILDLLEAELGREKFKYTIVSNLKLVSKYCLQENSLFFVNGKNKLSNDEGLTYRLFDKQYIQHYSAVVRAEMLNEDIMKYIEIIKTLAKEIR